ncbi:MAG: hypothetical protein H6832_13280 [Planctomycetes bacterium]|nr:hypothetical protein [Planctomycetota bacterium]MCB9892652.1 hypothetical protein [Planctomycetota bacterium]MCB9919369.1 hypothetical protein [Planctomycetota bacterium]
MIVSLVCVPLLLGVISTTTKVADTVTVNDLSSENEQSLGVIVERLVKELRAGHRASFSTKAIADDVTAMRASAIGEWIPAVELTPRKNLRFTSAEGKISMNAAFATDTREYDFFLDAGESDNGMDDDGDGMIDEGTLILRRAGGPAMTIARGVEAFAYEVDGRAIRLLIRIARRDEKGRIYRVSATPMIFVRNS